MKYTWLLFDADGTLFNYDQAEASALEQTFEYFQLRYELTYRQTYQRINHHLWLDFEKGLVTSESLRVKRFELLCAELGIQFDVEALSARYLVNLAKGSQLIEGADQVIQVLRQHYKLGLITNGLKDVQRPRLAQSALCDSFGVFIISEEVGAAKPDRAIFDIAFQKMGNPQRDQVLMIGDSVTSDIRGGNNYGIDTCWFNSGRVLRKDGFIIKYEISWLADLIQILL